MNRSGTLLRTKSKVVLVFFAKLLSLVSRSGAEVLGPFETHRDIKKSEKVFRSLFDQSDDGTYIFEPTGRILEVNQTACKQVGYEKYELLRMMVPRLVAPDRAISFANRIREVHGKGRLIFETVHLRKDGTIFPVEISVRPFDYLDRPALFATVRDIRNRKRVERHLAYREAVESLIAGISRRFVALSMAETDIGIDTALGELGEFAEVDRSYVFRISPEGRADCTHEWCADGVEPKKAEKQGLDLTALPWAIGKLLSQQTLHVPQVEALPPEAEAEKELWQGQGIRSLLTVPILTDRKVTGCIGFDAVRSEKRLVNKNLALLQTVSGIFGSAIERQHAAERLRESEERLSLALQVSNEGVWDWNLITGELYLSPRWFTMLGYEPEEFPKTVKSWVRLLHPHDRKDTVAKAEKCIREDRGAGYQLEFRMRTQRGDYVDILSRGEAFEFDGDGVPIRMVGTHMDITERKRAEEAFQAVHRRLQDIVEFLPDATFVIDGEKKLVAWNRAMEKMTGVSKEKVIGKEDYAYALPFFGISQPLLFDVIGSPEPRGGAKCESEKRKGETRFAEGFHPSLYGGAGGYLWGIAAPLFDQKGQTVGAIQSIRDITDRKKAEEALKKALVDAEQGRDKIDAILKSVGDGLVVADIGNRVVLMNREAERLAGVSQAEALSRPIGTLFAEECLNSQLSSVLTGEEMGSPVELEIIDHNSRQPRTIQAHTAMVQNREGENTGTITILRDVTREKELDRMKDEFISTAAHELRTPLTSVLGFSEVLLNGEEYGIADPAQQRGMLASINENAKKLESIISDLLDLSRVQSGQLIALDKAPGDICHLLNKVVAENRKRSGQHRFEVFLPMQPVELSVDLGKLEQVLENLISNAVKFSRQGSRVRVTGLAAGERFEVSVEDEGIGMTPEQVDKVFDKFYRVDASSTAAEGLGLGMSIVKNIVEAHGGEIRVQSALGRGTLVSFTIPLS